MVGAIVTNHPILKISVKLTHLSAKLSRAGRIFSMSRRSCLLRRLFNLMYLKSLLLVEVMLLSSLHNLLAA
jgi:hypothetical protein